MFKGSIYPQGQGSFIVPKGQLFVQPADRHRDKTHNNTAKHKIPTVSKNTILANCLKWKWKSG